MSNMSPAEIPSSIPRFIRAKDANEETPTRHACGRRYFVRIAFYDGRRTGILHFLRILIEPSVWFHGFVRQV